MWLKLSKSVILPGYLILKKTPLTKCTPFWKEPKQTLKLNPMGSMYGIFAYFWFVIYLTDIDPVRMGLVSLEKKPKKRTE